MERKNGGARACSAAEADRGTADRDSGASARTRSQKTQRPQASRHLGLDIVFDLGLVFETEL